MKQPFFSIIIATYNRASFIGTAIESIINQSFDDWELIVIDDGSSDNTKNVINFYLKDSRINYFFQNNQERSVARNNGITHAKGKYLCFLDSDDYFLPNHLSCFYYAIKNTESVNTVFVTNRYIENNGIKKKFKHPHITYDNLTASLINYSITYSPPIQSICIHHSAFSKIKFKDDWLPYCECYQFSYDLLKAGYTYNFLNTYSLVMVNHDNNTTVFSKEFLIKRLEYISYYASKLDIQKNTTIKTAKINLLINIAQFERSIYKKLTFLIKIIQIDFLCFRKRAIWVLMKNILIK